jgi:raffinose/stachyose/melibiose transport system substrate-binding protein
VNRRIRRAAAVAAAFVAAVTVAACSSSSSGGSTGASSASLLTAKAPRGVTLTLWHNTADPAALMDLYKAYEKWSGNTIDLVNIPASDYPTVVQTKWATGARPDILEWHGNLTDVLGLDIEKNAIPLTSLPFVKEEGALAKVSGSVAGQTYAATISFPSVFGLFYNKADFAKAGLAPPQNYADLASDCAVLKAKEPGAVPIYEAGGDQWPTQVLSDWDYLAQYNEGGAFDTSITDNSAKFTDPNGPFIAGLKAYDSLKSAGCFNKDATTATWDDSMQALLNGSAAMVGNSSDSVSLLDSDANGDTAKVDATVGFVGVSATKPVASYAPSPLGTFYVPKTSDTKTEIAAIQFIKFITGAGYATYVQEAGAIPTLAGTPAPKLQGLMQQIQQAYDAGATLTVNSAIPGYTSFGALSQGLLASQDTPAQVATKMQAYYLEADEASGH